MVFPNRAGRNLHHWPDQTVIYHAQSCSNLGPSPHTMAAKKIRLAQKSRSNPIFCTWFVGDQKKEKPNEMVKIKRAKKGEQEKSNKQHESWSASSLSSINTNMNNTGIISISGSISRTQSIDDANTKYRLSKRRWAILAGICIFGLCNGIVSSVAATSVNTPSQPCRKFY